MSSTPRLKAAKRDWGHDETGCTVLHIDMDAFYASLEVARHPELAGKPVIIGTGTRSVVSAANYKARRYGVNSAMATARARRLCTDGVFLPVDIDYYRRMSRRIFTEVFGRVTDAIEQVSVDEGYMDVSSALMRWGEPSAIGAWIREQVHRRFAITCSVGIASNKLVAKIASTNAKPDGMLLIPVASQARFVQMMPLRGIPGIGPALEQRLNAWGAHTVADLADMSEETLARATGSALSARHLSLASHGLDERQVTPRAPEKSIGAERTFDTDTRDRDRVCGLLRWCCDDIAASLRRRHLMARTVTLKLRFPDLHYATKAHTLQQPVDTASALYPQVTSLLDAMLGSGREGHGDASERRRASSNPAAPNRPEAPQPLLSRAIRLAGVSASGLEPISKTVSQPSIDDLMEEEASSTGTTTSARLRDAERTLDAIRHRYGDQAASLGA
ncbi:DNA polymerase IV [Bifidobacterium mongoliense]|uniref:DNA polymerase IV n=1 Tax=Bifidobacterium mongoliense TaxID=518643 RepID=UPI0030ECC929